MNMRKYKKNCKKAFAKSQEQLMNFVSTHNSEVDEIIKQLKEEANKSNQVQCNCIAKPKQK